MNKLTNYGTHPWAMHWWGFLFHIFLIIGIVTAATELIIASFTPMSWFLLAIACVLAMIWNVAVRTLARLESRREK